MFDLCESVTPLVQRNSIDEGYLDLAPCGLGTAEEVASAVRRLQERIWAVERIPVSMGIACNKLVAQIASKLRKPRGFVVVPPGGEAAFLAPLSIGKLPGVGAKTEAVLGGRGIRRIADLFSKSEDELRAIFGRDWREMLARARGEDSQPVQTMEEDAKSYSQQETFARDVAEFSEIERVAKRMVDELMPKIRSDRKRVRTMTVKVRYPDFSQESHGRSLESATDLEAPFYPLIGPLLRAAWKKRRPLRLVSVRLSGVDDGETQLEMFARSDEKRRRLAGVIDRLNRSGKDPVVTHGHQLGGRRG
jgi:DNA polymerase-4